MPIKVQVPSNGQINELRSLFLQKYEQQPPPKPFHPVDLHRVKNEDLWCRRFLEMYDLDMQVSLDKLWETCTWRQEYGAYDLSEKNLRADYLNDGVIFTRNKDIDGKPLLIFQTRLHAKGSKDMTEVMKVVVYWIERIHRETNMDQITVFFDMAGTGLSNMDLDFVKRIIEVFKMYYPNALNYILIFEMAWVLNAAFKVIKGLLPAKALEILKTISKKDINTYVDKDNCLESWGGNDNYKFTFVPEKKAEEGEPTKAISLATTTMATNGTVPADNEDEASNRSSSSDKKVHFANSSLVRHTALTLAPVEPMQDYESFKPPMGYMLRVSPREFLTFPRGDGSESCVELTCVNDFPISYKIQTTSPDKFRVRPRCGMLHRGESVVVNIVLKGDKQLADAGKDKFLVMCIPVPADLSPQELTDYWKSRGPNNSDVEQHRLCCVYKGAECAIANGRPTPNQSECKTGDDANNKDDLWDQAKRLEKHVVRTQILQGICLLISMITAIGLAYLINKQMSSEEDLSDCTCSSPGSYGVRRD